MNTRGMGDRRGRAAVWTIALALAFLFRLAYGLASMFWTEDERQIYLIGLRSYARGGWPFFGADVVWTGSRLPGALQALLVRVPLALWHAPEAPFLLLNLLSFGALALLAWYCRRRMPDLPAWFVWGVLLLLPWTLNFSTHIVNTSYILPAAIVFFVGFFEAAPAFRIGVLPRRAAWALMGAGLLFLVQIHMSWVLLPAYVAAAALDAWRTERSRLPANLIAFAAGAASTGSLLLPTLVRDGWRAGGMASNVQLQLQGPQALVAIVARFLSFPAFEVVRFLGLDTADRLLFLWREPWVAPFALVVLIAGLIQPLIMAALWFRRGAADWTRLKWLALATVLWVYASFFFSVRGPLAHAFYVVFPVAAVYTFAGWRWLAGPRLWRAAAVVLIAGVALHLGVIVWQLPRRSLYRDRALVQAAIDIPNDRLLGDRRDSAVEPVAHAARPLDAVAPGRYAAASARDDLELVRAAWSPVVMGMVSRFSVTIENRGRDAAYVDIRFSTRYRGAGGRIVAQRQGVIKEILEPGVRRDWPDLPDGLVPDDARSATLTIDSAEKVIPLMPPGEPAPADSPRTTS
jgi:hypothetical protein